MKINTLLNVLLIMLMSHVALAQHQYADWVKTLDSEHNNTSFNNSLFDGENYVLNGYYFIEGSFNGIVLPEAIGANALITKIDPAGNLIWHTTVTGDDAVAFYDMAFDSENNIVLAGWTTAKEAVYVNDELIITGDGSWVNNSIVIKLSAEDGSLLWHRNWKGAEYTSLNTSRITVDASDNIYVSGYYNAPFELDGISFPYNFTFGDDVFVLKFDETGQLVWGNYWPSVEEMGFSLIRSLAVDETSIYFALEYSKPVIINGETLPHTGEYYWLALVKLDKEAGNVIDYYAFGSEGGQLIQQIALDHNNDLIVTGWFSAETPIQIGDYTLSGYHGNDSFVFKIDTDFNVIWAKQMGGDYADRAFHVEVSQDNTIFVGGGFYSGSDYYFEDEKILQSRLPETIASYYVELSEEGSFIQATGLYGDLEGTLISPTSATAIVSGSQLKVLNTGTFNGELSFVSGESIYTDHDRGFVYQWTLPYLTNLPETLPKPANNSCEIIQYADRLQFKFEGESIEVSIFSLDGKALLKQTVFEGEVLNTSRFNTGSYLLILKHLNWQQGRKFIIY